MKGKRRISSSLVPIDKNEADDFGYDVRLVRRLKRRRIAFQDFKVNSIGRHNPSKGGGKYDEASNYARETPCVRVDVDLVDDDADSDYREYLDSLNLEAASDSDAGNHTRIDNGDNTGVGTVAVDTMVDDHTHPNDAFNDADHQYVSKHVIIDIDEEGDCVGADYSKYVDLEALSDCDAGKCKSLNTGGDRVVENMLVNDGAFADGDPQHEAIHEGYDIRSDENKDFTDADYKKFSDLVLFDSGAKSDSFVNSGSDVNAVDGYIENSSGDKLVDNESAKDDINDSTIYASGHMDRQPNEIHEINYIDLAANECTSEHIDDNNNNVDCLGDIDIHSNKIAERSCVKSNDDKRNVNNSKIMHSTAIGQSVDSDVWRNWSADDIAAEPNGDNQSADNDTLGNWSAENATIAGGSIETRSATNDGDQNDDLDDPHYKMFLEHLREEGKSYVLEIAVNDGICRIVYEMDTEPHDMCREKKNRKRTRPMQEAAGQTEHGSQDKLLCDEIDHSYRIFLNSLKREGRHVVFIPAVGPKVVYDEDVEYSSDSEVIVMDSDPFADKDYTPFVTSKPNLVVEEDEGSDWIETRNDSSWFKERVTEILRDPYDKMEFETLFRELYRRRPVDSERDLRNGRTRTCSANKIGKSYFQQYTDLAKQINSVGANKPKVLNLMRGFFFWLQNVAHDGVFKPWMDSSCLEILPSLR